MAGARVMIFTSTSPANRRWTVTTRPDDGGARKMFDEEPLDRFQQRALAQAGRMRFDPYLVNEAIATLTGSFGAEWVANEADTQQLGTPWPFRRHPVGGMIDALGEDSIAAALELAHYLKVAANSHAFPTLIAQIKEGDKTHYRHTRLQLAFHSRFVLLADEPPTLEPNADGGRVADIELHRSDQRYLVECYAPQVDDSASDEVHWLTKQTIDALGELDGAFSVAIQLLSIPRVSERKQLCRQITQTAKRLGSVHWRGGLPLPSELIELPIACVSVSRTLRGRHKGRPLLFTHPSFPDLGDPNQVLMSEEAPAKAVRAVSATALRGTPVDNVAVWLPVRPAGPPESVDEHILRLVPRMRRKLAQTRSRDARRVMIVETWMADSQFTLSEDARTQVERAIFGAHSDVAGILLVRRHFDRDVKRHTYRMRPFVHTELGDFPIPDLVSLEYTLRIPELLP